MTNAHSPGNNRFYGNQAPLTVAHVLSNTEPATAANFGTIFCAPYDCVLREVRVVWRTASTSGTLQVERLQGTEAKDAGDDLLASTIDLSGAAETVNTGTLITTNAGNLQLSAGDRLGLVNGGNLANGVEVTVTCILTPLT